MPALDALHMKQTAYEGLHTPFWHRMGENMMESFAGRFPGVAGLGPAWTEETEPDFTARQCRTLTAADSFYVSPTMNRLVTAAAESWPNDEPVEQEDWPTPFGWLFIPGGITNVDIRGKVLHTSAVSWALVGGRARVTYWADKMHDPPDVRARDGWDDLPRLTPWHIVEVPFGQPLPHAITMGMILPPEVSEEIQYVQNPANPNEYAMTIPKGYSRDELLDALGRGSAKVDGVLAWVVSALRIMQQPLADVEPVGVPANVRRALLRHPIRVRNTAVTIIEFRRRTGDYQEGTGRTFSHRFLRRGHWRRQPYKRDDGTWDRRRIWIHPTIVGDPDKPLLLREHVNALTR